MPTPDRSYFAERVLRTVKDPEIREIVKNTYLHELFMRESFLLKELRDIRKAIKTELQPDLLSKSWRRDND